MNVYYQGHEGSKWNHPQQQPFNGRLSGTTRVGRYQKKHSPAHTHPGQRTSFITFLHLQSPISLLYAIMKNLLGFVEQRKKMEAEAPTVQVGATPTELTATPPR